MKKIIIEASILLLLIITQIAFASSGLLFNVNASGLTLTITTTTANHFYPEAGIKVNTSGYALAGVGTECMPSSNGYCLFSVSDTQPKDISITGSSGTLGVTLCLNGPNALSCQNYNDIPVTSGTKFVYVANYQGNGDDPDYPAVWVCSVDPTTGLISSCADAGADAVFDGVHPQGIVLNNDSTIAYLTNADDDSEVFQCAIDSTDGTFSSCNTITVTTTVGEYEPEYGLIALNPDNTIAYLVDNYTDGTSIFGRLLACPIVAGNISGSCVDTGATGIGSSSNFQDGVGIAINSTGTTAYIGLYSGSPPGVLVCDLTNTPVGECTLETGASGISFEEPAGVALNPAGNLLYVADYQVPAVYACEVDFTSCFVAADNASVGIALPWGIALNESNAFAYVSTYDDILFQCTIDASDGTFSSCTPQDGLEEGVGIALAY